MKHLATFDRILYIKVEKKILELIIIKLEPDINSTYSLKVTIPRDNELSERIIYYAETGLYCPILTFFMNSTLLSQDFIKVEKCDLSYDDIRKKNLSSLHKDNKKEFYFDVFDVYLHDNVFRKLEMLIN